MEHYLNICNVKGNIVKPVDVVTFGSPCQDLSIAGARAGLDGSRSNLFFEGIRVIKEMRESTDGQYPKYAIWENVPGAFSSNKGKDFATVLETFSLVADEEASSVSVPDKGWPTAGCLQDMDGGWSIAWRVIDAQHWGVPQRRRRIFVVADFTGSGAREILFKCESLRGDSTESGVEGQGASTSVEDGSEESNQVGAECLTVPYGIGSYHSAGMLSNNPHSGIYQADTSRTLDASGGTPACNQGGIAIVTDSEPTIAFHLTQDPIASEEVAPCLGCGSSKGQATVGVCSFSHTANTLRAGAGAPKHEADFTGRLVVEGEIKPICLQGSVIGRELKNGPQGSGVNEDVSFTLNATDRHAVCCVEKSSDPEGQSLFENNRCDVRYRGPLETAPTICARYGTGGVNTPFVVGNDELYTFDESSLRVRRLTPTECARLQGFPYWWGVLEKIEEMPDDDYEFFKQNLLEVGLLEEKIIQDESSGEYFTKAGKAYKNKTKEQMVKWYNKLHSDSPEYKMWGNGVALPCVREPLHNMARLGAETLGSLFDGSGGFPLAGVLEGMTPLWSSEIATYPSAVTRQNFRDLEALKKRLQEPWQLDNITHPRLLYQKNIGALCARDSKGINTFAVEAEKLILSESTARYPKG